MPPVAARLPQSVSSPSEPAELTGSFRTLQSIGDVGNDPPAIHRDSGCGKLGTHTSGQTFVAGHSRSCRAQLPETISVPSGLKATLFTRSRCPFIDAPMGLPLLASQSRNVLSELPETMRVPSALKATLALQSHAPSSARRWADRSWYPKAVASCRYSQRRRACRRG